MILTPTMDIRDIYVTSSADYDLEEIRNVKSWLMHGELNENIEAPYNTPTQTAQISPVNPDFIRRSLSRGSSPWTLSTPYTTYTMSRNRSWTLESREEIILMSDNLGSQTFLATFPSTRYLNIEDKYRIIEAAKTFNKVLRRHNISFRWLFVNTYMSRAVKVESPKEEVLESFIGKVDRIEGDIAYVSLVDSKEQKSYADCDAVELKSQGILESGRFICNIKKRNNETVITFEPIPRRRLSDEEWHQLHQETIENLGDYDSRDDY